MKKLAEQMRSIARQLLTDGKVTLVLGWEKGKLEYKPAPVFIRRPEDAERLIFNEFCHPNLVKYLLDLVHGEGRIAVFVKGCDSRAVLRLIQDNCLTREQVLILGIACPGLRDPAAASGQAKGGDREFAEKCLECRYPVPLIYDSLVGQQAKTVDNTIGRTMERIGELEAASTDERYQFWTEHFAKCIRCYACRNVCPACNCRECTFDQHAPKWLGKANNLTENQFMQLTRAMHVAGRCIECGECQRVCPMNIPLMTLNKKIAKDLQDLFGEEPPGTALEQKPPLGHFKLNDPEEFM